MRLLATVLLALTSTLASAQLAEPNPAGIAMGHLHYRVQDLATNTTFWTTLGGEVVRTGPDTVVIRFPDVFVVVSEGDAAEGTEGSVISHVAFRVLSLEDIESRGLEVDRLDGYIGVASVYTPEGERIELFDETATNLTFTRDDGRTDPVSDRHNQPLSVPVIAHHVHLYIPTGQVETARDWYVAMFGGIPGMRYRYTAVDLPGINLNFSESETAAAPTRGRRLDHIGLEVRDLEAFCRRAEERGAAFEIPCGGEAAGLGGVRRGVLTDPWGTRIELTEGLGSFR